MEGALRCRHTGPTFVGINGIDNSGKTVFATSLARYLSARGMKMQLVHLDDFHNPRSVRTSGSDEMRAYTERAFDLQALELRLLKPAHLQGSVRTEIVHLDLETDRFAIRKQYDIDENTVVLVEGTLLYREPIDQYLDYRIFLEVTFDEAARRAEVRDKARFGPEITERYRCKYFPIQRWYMNHYMPQQRANLVIDNNDYKQPKIIRHGS